LSRIRDLRIDNAVGMLASQIVMWSIIVVTGTVLHGHNVTNIATAADAATALEPLVSGFTNAGFVAKAIFAFGIVGLGLISVPVLAGSAAYVTAEAFQWRHGLSRRLREAHGFYGVITLATVVGLMINFVGIDPIQALIITSVINAIVAIPLVWILIFISSDRSVMGNRASGPLSQTLLWTTFFVLVTSAGAMIYTGISH
jgi:Mn2+/Fe2+ NRAMP family transporter